MNSKILIEAYMRAKNITQVKQAAISLHLSNSYINDIHKGHREFADETAVYIAKEIGLDPAEVVISINAAKAKTPEMKETWYIALKKYCASTGTALAVGMMTMTGLDLEPILTASKYFLC